MFILQNHLINRSVPKVDKSYSLNRTYSLFRTLGTRHLVVIDHSNQVAGIITRKDLMNYNVTTRLIGVEERMGGDDSDYDEENNSFGGKDIPTILTHAPSNELGHVPPRDSDSEYTYTPNPTPTIDPRHHTFTSDELPLKTITDETNL